MSTIVLTGGTGFLGSWIIRALDQSTATFDFDTLRLVARNLPRARMTRVDSMNLEVVSGDLLAPETMARVGAGADVVIHVAALYDTKGSWRSFYTSNVTATEALINGMDAGSTLILTSTYGVCGFPRGTITEDYEPKRPVWHYQKSKKLQEDLARELCAVRGIRFAAIRPPTVIGPGELLVVPTVIRAIRAGQMMIIGDGNNRMPYGHPSDIADAHLLALQRIEDVDGGAFHLASFHATVNDYLGAFTTSLGVPAVERHAPLWMARAVGFMGDLLRGVGIHSPYSGFSVAFLSSDETLDITKAKKRLGFQSHFDLNQTVSQAVEWYEREKPQGR